MKHRIEYKSETVLPYEIAKMFSKAEKNIADNKYEIDKIFLHLERLKYECIVWFSEHETVIEDETP